MKTLNYNKKIVSGINKIKYGLIISLVVFCFSFIDVSKTSAFFTDEASVSGTVFATGTLKFSLDNSADFTSSPLEKGGSATYRTTLVNNGSLGFQHKVSTTNITGNLDLCAALTLKAKLNDNVEYRGSLSDFSYSAQTYIESSIWDFTVTLPNDTDDSLQSKNCTFKFTFDGWQENLSSGEGFNDTAQINGSLSSAIATQPINSGIVINEILPNPEGKGSDDMPNGEWVELYNKGEVDVYVTGWYLSDKTPGNGNETPINSEHIGKILPIVPARGYLVVYMNKQIYNNKSDTVQLFNNLNNSIDDYSYDANNYCDNTSTLKGKSETNIAKVCDSIPENKSISRIPDGSNIWEVTTSTKGKANKADIETLVSSEQFSRSFIVSDEFVADEEENSDEDTPVTNKEEVTPDIDGEEISNEKDEVTPEIKMDESLDDEAAEPEANDNDETADSDSAADELDNGSDTSEEGIDDDTQTEDESEDDSTDEQEFNADSSYE